MFEQLLLKHTICCNPADCFVCLVVLYCKQYAFVDVVFCASNMYSVCRGNVFAGVHN